MHGSGWGRYLRSTDEKPSLTWDLIKRVLAYSSAYHWQLIGLFITILVSSGLSLLSPLIVRELIDSAIPSKDIHKLFLLSLGLLALPALNGMMSVLQRRLNTGIGEGVIFDLRASLYEKFQQMSLRFFTHTKVGEMMSRMNNDVVGAQNAISNTIVNIITDFIQAVAVFSVMATIEWKLTLVSVAILPLFILAARLLGGRLRLTAHQQMDANARMNALMNETLNIGGVLLVKIFGQQKTETERFRQRANNVKDLGIKRAVYGSLFIVIISLLSAVGSSLIYGFGGYQVIIGNLSIGTIVAFGSYLGMLYRSLQSLANAPVEFSTSVVSFERVFEVIDLPVEIADKQNAIQLDQVEGEIKFENVSFQYDDSSVNTLNVVERVGKMDNVTAALSSEEPAIEEKGEIRSQARETALRDISLTIEPGQLTALVGPSGAGKTTLTYLIPRLYDPDKGRILIDGHDTRDITLKSLISHIGMVTQETYLFHDSIFINLQYANLDASMEDIEAAAKIANIHEFISQLPEKYETIVGERGYRLSGGEKQRIALARVILKDPSILILDEATSSLDSESEALIQEALKRVMSQRTSIVIAHRLSTILSADQILVLDRGKIAEKGTHKELLEQKGIYSRLYETQFKRE